MVMKKQKVTENIKITRDVPVSMRDGTILYADIYRPDDQEKYPVLLLRTPYNKSDAQTMNYAHPIWYAKNGYVVIVQDTRGRWKSEGTFDPYKAEGQDGYDTVEWAAHLPDVEPKVGMYGFSYAAAVQLLTAAERPPHLKCIVPAMIGSDGYNGHVYKHGAFALALNLSWTLFVSQDEAFRRGKWDWLREISFNTAAIQSLYHYLPLKDVPAVKEELTPFYQKWLEHHVRDEYWDRYSMQDHYEKINVPVLHIGGWYDIFIDGTIENFQGIKKYADAKAASEQYLFIAPWYHMPWSRYVGELDFGEHARNRIDEIQLSWFNRWLKDEENEWCQKKPVKYFLMGSNEWREASQWPPPNTINTNYYLHSSYKANSINGDGKLSIHLPEKEASDIFVYHPSIPVPALGGRSGADPVLTPMGPKNQLPIEARNDVLVYTSDILEEDVSVVGDIKVILYASTTAEDTDFVVKLIDVHPNGNAYNVAEGIIRASFRNSLERQEPVPASQIIKYEINAGAIANVFKKGHSIRLDITSSLFPTFDRNPNRLVKPGSATEADFIAATQTIYHGGRYPSHVILPIVKEQR
ncbi:putative peptidase [Parageobacillus thermoglucosidasius]|nr:putative peptidase [Parageobacillus thermoglucosidasius]